MPKQRHAVPADEGARLTIPERRPPSLNTNAQAKAVREQPATSRIAVALFMTPLGNDRLVAALGRGHEEFVLTDVSGGLAVRVRVAIDNASFKREPAATLDGAIIDWSTGRVERDGRQTVLSRIELRLLACLIDAQPSVVAHDRLIEAAWPHDPPADPRNALAVYINYLRRRLRPVGLGGVIRTRRSAGYALISTTTSESSP